MIPNTIRVISSGGIRLPSFNGTNEPSTRKMGGSPALRWMSEEPPRSATCKISFSSPRAGLVNDHLRGLSTKVLIDRATIDDHRPGSGLDPDPGDRFLASAGRIKTIVVGGSHRYASTSRTVGFWAACGCSGPG